MASCLGLQVLSFSGQVQVQRAMGFIYPHTIITGLPLDGCFPVTSTIRADFCWSTGTVQIQTEVESECTWGLCKELLTRSPRRCDADFSFLQLCHSGLLPGSRQSGQMVVVLHPDRQASSWQRDLSGFPSCGGWLCESLQLETLCNDPDTALMLNTTYRIWESEYWVMNDIMLRIFFPHQT